MTPVIVATAAELQSALQNAKGGETILLKGGDYGGLSTTANLGYDGPFASTVTIASQDPNDPATFSGLYLYNTGNIVIEDVVFDYTRSEDDVHFTRPFQVKDSTNVTIKNSVFDGDTKPYVSESGVEDLGWAYGLSVRNASEITLEGNEFYDWIRGAVIDNVENIIVRENDVHDIRSDGMDFVNVQNVLIEDNHFHDFKAAYGSADHRDMIQFWTSGTTTPSTDIIIRNNLLDMGEGSYTQSIPKVADLICTIKMY
jgi:hypothetical protein